MKLYSFDALRNVVSQSWLTNFAKSIMVIECNELMEFSIQVVEVTQIGCVEDKLAPVIRLG